MELFRHKRIFIVLGANSIGLTLESSDGSSESSEENNKSTNWAMVFAQLIKHYGFSLQEVLDLSYPQFKALYSVVFEPQTFDITIPYMGNGEKDETEVIKQEENEVNTKEGIMQMIARANAAWK